MFPGGLTISSSIGDVESKYPQFGGRTRVVISTPDIISINYKNTFDFILLGCDGIFDKLSNKDISLIVFTTLKNAVVNSKPYNKFLNKVTINIMKEAISKGSKDNLSCIFLCCDSIKEMFNKKDLNQINEAISAVTNTTYDTNTLYRDYYNAVFLSPPMKTMPRVKTGLEFKHKSTLNYNNIQLENSGLSFQRSGMSGEGKSSELNKKKSSKINETIQSNSNKKSKKDWCCGLFA